LLINELQFYVIRRCQVPKDDTYNYMLEVLSGRTNEKIQTAREYNWKREFILMKAPKTEWIVRKKVYDEYIAEFGRKHQQAVPRICKASQLFESIYEAHTQLSHAAGYVTHKELTKKFSNISKNMVKVFVRFCPICSTNRYVPQRKTIIKPILSETFNDRGQIDLIDMQAQADGPFNWILHYQDHLTKFSHLIPLRKKSTLSQI